MYILLCGSVILIIEELDEASLNAFNLDIMVNSGYDHQDLFCLIILPLQSRNLVSTGHVSIFTVIKHPTVS